MEHIPSSEEPGCGDGADGDLPRAYFAPHTTVDRVTGMRMIHPASHLTLGAMQNVSTGQSMPTIRVDHGFGPTSLVFVPTAAEMRVLAAQLIAAADKMEREADDMLANALKRRPEA